MKLKRWMRWTIGNTCIAILIYAGLWHGVEGAARVLQFYVWFAFFLSLFFFSDEIVVSTKEKLGGRVIPEWLDTFVDMAFVVALVWHGWIWSGVAFLAHMLLSSRVYAPLKEKTSNPA